MCIFSKTTCFVSSIIPSHNEFFQFLFLEFNKHDSVYEWSENNLSGCFIFAAVRPSNTRIFLKSIFRQHVYAHITPTKLSWKFGSKDYSFHAKGLCNKKIIVDKCIFGEKLRPFKSGAFSENSSKSGPNLLHPMHANLPPVLLVEVLFVPLGCHRVTTQNGERKQPQMSRCLVDLLFEGRSLEIINQPNGISRTFFSFAAQQHPDAAQSCYKIYGAASEA
jgi:hypothetical protein